MTNSEGPNSSRAHVFEPFAPCVHRVQIHFFGHVTRRPWWGRKMRFTHMAVQLGDLMVDLPLTSGCDMWEVMPFLAHKCKEPIEWGRIDVEAVGEPFRIIAVVDDLIGLRHQPRRTFLQALGLWPWAINCMTPARRILRALGVPMRGRTPDACYRSLQRQSTSGLASGLHAIPPEAGGLGGGSGETEVIPT